MRKSRGPRWISMLWQYSRLTELRDAGRFRHLLPSPLTGPQVFVKTAQETRQSNSLHVDDTKNDGYLLDGSFKLELL